MNEHNKHTYKPAKSFEILYRHLNEGDSKHCK